MQGSVDRAVQRALLLRDAKAQAGLGAPIGSPQQEAGWQPSPVQVPIRPQPASPLTPESVSGPDSAGRANILTPLAKKGDPRAAQELLRRGRSVLFVPDDIGSMSAQDFADLLRGISDQK
jgi:hypothetical protein